MLALTSATGKLGSAVISALLDNNLIDPKDLVICTSSPTTSPKLSSLRRHPITIRHADFTSPSSLRSAYASCTSLFLVSTPAIQLDYAGGPGRETHHIAAIDAALAVGVRNIYYTSLAFANPSKAGVMRAHTATEKYLAEVMQSKGVGVTVLRVGLYSESWPLYLGYYYDLKEDPRTEVVVAGDGPVSWTAIADLGFCTAKILAAPREEWKGRTVYLSQMRTGTLTDVAACVSRVRGEEVRVKVVGREEYVEEYAGKGIEKDSVEWWSSTYEALKDGECGIEDQTLEMILGEAGKKPRPWEEAVEEMMR